jgi:hypothetical protein
LSFSAPVKMPPEEGELEGLLAHLPPRVAHGARDVVHRLVVAGRAGQSRSAAAVSDLLDLELVLQDVRRTGTALRYAAELKRSAACAPAGTSTAIAADADGASPSAGGGAHPRVAPCQP